MKNKIIAQRNWDLNIGCGKTDGGGVNADIVKHADLPRFKKIDDIYNLPFKNDEFDNVLCSHVMEHVDKPELFFEELNRVGNKVYIVIPPLWDLGAVFNIFEHKRIFLSINKVHNTLPAYVNLPFSNYLQEKFGQIIKA
ncbi:MAG: methyltransferase domain-containing protein [Halanaerobium sp.]